MSDRLFFSLAALLAVAMILLAAVWPQGLGARSPGAFGHPVAKPPTPAPSNASSLPIDAHAAAVAAGLRTGQ
jgi:hypothetical protein